MSALASLKLTAVSLLLLGAGVTGSYVATAPSAWSIALPMALLAANLGGAVARNPVFRRQAALLVFHLALLALALLAAAGQLTKLTGRVELTEGEAFAGELLELERGPLHPWRLDRVQFVNEGFEIDYAPDLRRGATRNRVRWRDERGAQRAATIGDQTPLVVHGYRFSTSPNKGFAPVFVWRPAHGAPQRGSVHLPSYPAWRDVQAAEWTPRGLGGRLTLTLHLEEPLATESAPWRFALPVRHSLELEIDGARRRLVPGESLDLGAGTLRYERLATWMGYRVFWDWTLPWLAAAGLVAAASLAWHIARRVLARPWRESA
jgi:cytochrome c biogenesis protein